MASLLLLAACPALHDYIVVGGGVAGCAVAERLVSGSTSSVLLLEAGVAGHYVNGGDAPPPFGEDSTLVSQHQLTKFDVPGAYGEIAWNNAYAQYKQPEIALGWQARVLGGGGLINGALTMRPPSSDLDLLPDGWRAAIEAQFTRLEEELNITPTPSSDGLSYGGETRALLEQGMSLLYGTPTVPLNTDPDSRDNTLSVPTVTAKDGVRQSTASFHLERAKASPRFELRLQATVTQLMLGADGNATGVVYTDALGSPQTALINPGGRVILTAGALATPRLLWLSGIGPAEELTTLQSSGGLSVDSSLWRVSPGVGAHLNDHAISTLTFKIPEALAPNRSEEEYLLYRSGILAQYGPVAVGYLRCDTCDTPNAMEDVEIFAGPASADDDGMSSTFKVSLMLLAPVTESKLAFDDNMRAFVADYGKLYMTDERDISVMASAANRTIHAVLSANSNVAVQRFGLNDWGPLDACNTEDGSCAPGEAPTMESIRNWLNNGWSGTSNNRGQVNHYAGTCALGECASVADGLVESTGNIHVADGSLLRYQLRAHPVLTVMALASEVAGRLLLSDPKAVAAPPLPPPLKPPLPCCSTRRRSLMFGSSIVCDPNC